MPVTHPCQFCGKPHRPALLTCSKCHETVPSCLAVMVDREAVLLVHQVPCWRKPGTLASCGPLEL